MESFRLILLLAGIGLIAGIYAWGRHTERVREYKDDGPDPASDLPELTEPFAGETDDELWFGGPLAARRDSLIEEEQLAAMSLRGTAEEPDLDSLATAPAMPSEADDGEKSAHALEEIVLVLMILAPVPRTFSGEAIAEAVQSAGLEFGAMDIFHRYAGEGQRPIFSLANGVEPGTFVPAAMGRLRTPALALFMRLPGPCNGTDALQEMLDSGRTLAESLGGELCDERRRSLTDESIFKLEQLVRPYAEPSEESQ